MQAQEKITELGSVPPDLLHTWSDFGAHRRPSPKSFRDVALPRHLAGAGLAHARR